MSQTSTAKTIGPIRRATRHILLVEDHPAMREAVAELLETDAELDVVAAVESAEEALELLETRRPDLAVVDLNLPGMHGLELVSELHRRTPGIPVVVLSSHSPERYAPAALDAGARAYVEKIRTAAELLGTVREALDLPRRQGANGEGHAYTAANRNTRPTGPEPGYYDNGRPLDDGFDGPGPA